MVLFSRSWTPETASPPDDIVLYNQVLIGEETTLDRPCVIGKPARNRENGDDRTIIGSFGHIRPFTVIYAETVIGDGLQTGQGTTIREGNLIGDNVKIGTNTVLEPGNRIGNNVRIHTGCFLERTVVEDDVFIGPHTVFTDDPHPPCPEYQECSRGVRVRRRAKIGAHCTILPGITIGENAVVGAGTVVVRDVPANTVVAGNPGRVIKSVSQLTCEARLFSRPYIWEND